MRADIDTAAKSTDAPTELEAVANSLLVAANAAAALRGSVATAHDHAHADAVAVAVDDALAKLRNVMAEQPY